MKRIIQITAGRGPAECSWVVAQVLKLFLDEVKEIGIDYLILQNIKGLENGTIESVTLVLDGIDVVTFLKTWLGTVQWIGTSKFRKHHKRKNWFIGIFEVYEAQMLEINEKEIEFQTMRSSGSGGQNVNKVNSAVRAIHKPTGVMVVAMDSRSQYQNKKLAIERLKSKVYEANLNTMKRMINDQWENHLNLQRGNPIRVFKGTDFKNQKVMKTYKNTRKQLKQDLRNDLKN